nr:outer membrane protein transport protein [Rhizobiaceae bacterium]
MTRILSAATVSLLASAVFVTAANAGGFSRGTADTDILFDEANFNMRVGVTYVSPNRKLNAGPNAGETYTDSYLLPSAAIKLKVTDSLSCAGTYTDAYGGSVSYRLPNTTGVFGKTSENFTVAELGLTCAYFVPMETGRFAVLGGVFLESFDYDLTAVVPNPANGNPTPLDVGLSSVEYGYRVGLAYEIPDIALRAQLMYRSGTDHDPTGSTFLSGTPILLGPASGDGSLPQSVEAKFQTGIAPGWLAFGSVKWTDWSVTDRLNLVVLGTNRPNIYNWKDGWTVTAGIGHSFNETVSGAASITWDQGVGTGWDLSSDTWTFASGVSIKAGAGGELRFGGAVSYLTSA